MDINKFKYLLIFGLLSFNIYNVDAQTFLHDLSDNPIPLDTTVRYGKLKNGFTYYIKKSQHQDKEVYMKLAVKAGSFFEKRSQEGYAHLLEHVVLFNRNPKDFEAMIESVGMNSRGQTGQIVTKYQIIIPDANKEKLGLGMDALKSWSSQLKFDSHQVGIQRGAVLGEMRSKDPYRDWLNKRYRKIMLQNANLPMYSEERIAKNITRFNMDLLKEFYKDWYRPDMQAAIIVGDIDPDSIQALVEKNFSGIKKLDGDKNYENILKRFHIQLEGENQYDSFQDSIDDGSRLIMFTKEKNHDYNKISERDFHQSFLQKIVNHITLKRSQNIQTQYYPPFSNYTNTHTVSNSYYNQILVSSLQVNLNENPEEIDKKISSALTAFKSLFSKITEQEIKDARSVLESEFIQTYEKNFGLAEAYLDNFIRGSAAPSPTRQAKLQNILTNIKVNEVQHFANQKANLLKDKDFVFINMPKGYLTGRKKIIDIIRSISDKPISFNPPILKMDLADSIDLKYVNSTTNKPSTNLIGVTRVKLNNGIDVWLKPTKPRSDEFKNQIEVLGFQPLNTGKKKNDVIPKIVAHSYASYAGTAEFNKFQVDHYLQKRNMKLQFRTEDNDFLIEGKFQKENLDDFFKLLFLKIQEPDKDTAAFSFWKRKEKSKNAVRGSSDFFRSEIEKIWHPNYPFNEQEILDTLSRDLILREYINHFSDFKNYSFILTGDFNSETLLKQISKYLETLPVSGNEDNPQQVSKKFSIRKRNDTIRLKNLDQALAEIYYPIKVPVDIKTQAILEVIKHALNERVFKRLRIGSYSPGASGFWIDKKNGIYTFLIDFDSELGYEQNMLGYAEDEFLKLRETGVDQEWLDTKIKLQINKHQQVINSFGYFNFWPEYLKESIKNKEDPEDWILQYPSLLQNFISLEEVNEAIRNYLSVTNQQTFLVLPEEKIY